VHSKTQQLTAIQQQQLQQQQQQRRRRTAGIAYLTRFE